MHGINLGPIILKKPIVLSELKGKKIACDIYVDLYQFLRKMPVLTDSKGRITSHLSGLFYRTTHLMKYGLKLCFVFDGDYIEVGERHKRIQRKKVQPRQTTTITPEIVKESKELLQALGLPVIQAPTEGEAQCAFMAQKRSVWAVGSQDFDCLIFGAPRMILNITLAKKKRLPAVDMIPVQPYLIELKEVLKKLKLTFDKFIALAILSGTDWNPGGASGVSVKTALKLVKQHQTLNKIFAQVNWPFDFSPDQLFDLIKTIPVTDKYKLEWKKPDKKAIMKLLCQRHDFNRQRIETRLEEIHVKNFS